MLHQKNNLAEKIEEEYVLRSNLPPLSKNILESIKTHGVATVKELEASTKANRNTIKVHLKQLQQRGHLKVQGQGKGTRYTIV